MGCPLEVCVGGMTATVSGRRASEFEGIYALESDLIEKMVKVAPSDTRIVRGFG